MAARLSTCMGLVFNFTHSHGNWLKLFSIIIYIKVFIYNMHHGLIIIYILHTVYFALLITNVYRLFVPTST